MFIRITKTPKGKKHVYMVESLRDTNGKTKQVIIEKYGDLDELLAQDADALNKLRQEAKKRSDRGTVEININDSETSSDGPRTRNYGYFFIERIYHKLGLDKYFIALSKANNYGYDINEIVKLLTYTRIINPATETGAHKRQKKYFYPFQTQLENIYKSFAVLSAVREQVQQTMHQNVEKHYGRSLRLAFYDLKSYPLEPKDSSEFRYLDPPSEMEASPVIEMGLLSDQNRIPIGFELFPGNTSDSKSMQPFISKLKPKSKPKRTIIVANRAGNTNQNLLNIVNAGNGYIVSEKVRGARKEFLAEVLNDDGYTYWDDSFKYKEFFRTRTIDEKNNSKLKEKVLVYWSRKHDAKRWHKYEKLNEKIARFVSSPPKPNMPGSQKDIKAASATKGPNQIPRQGPVDASNKAKHSRKAMLEGYYALVTSELQKPPRQILASYYKPWKIDKSHKAIRFDLEGRPAFLRGEDQVQGNFLICFIALAILQIIRLELKNKFSNAEIKDGIRTATCMRIVKDLYTIEKQSPLIQELERVSKVFIKYANCSLEDMRQYRKRLVEGISVTRMLKSRTNN